MKRNHNGSLALFGFVVVVVVLWGLILPRVAQWRAVREREDRFSKAGIHPAAIYYSDHPSMKEIEGRVSRKWNR
ncbi:MAG: hypothetical protein MUC43_05465 [Pirellula sp.]|nr:hypothetical protein [Pirellula sp.]